jgi:multicomponent Na+:H+ antiporter subunit E
MTVKSKIILGLGFIALWLLLNAHMHWYAFVVGVVIAVVGVYIIGPFFQNELGFLCDPRRYFYFFVLYIPVFVWECLKANLDVAYRIIHPGLPIRPGIVKVMTSLKSEMGLTFLANSITLTPGTLTVDIDKNTGVLYVHWLCVRSTEGEDATRRIVKRFEGIVKKIFE